LSAEAATATASPAHGAIALAGTLAEHGPSAVGDFNKVKVDLNNVKKPPSGR